MSKRCGNFHLLSFRNIAVFLENVLRPITPHFQPVLTVRAYLTRRNCDIGSSREDRIRWRVESVCLPHFRDLKTMQPFSCIRRCLASEDGPTAVEYAVMLSFIVIVCLTAITTIGANANGVFNKVANGHPISARAGGRSPTSPSAGGRHALSRVVLEEAVYLPRREGLPFSVMEQPKKP